jgi:predicted RNA-binding Zn-ribbon protein involved in translation (DUF1610 family)
MEGNGIKIGLIVSVALAVCLSIGMAVETMFGGTAGASASADTKIWFKCVNPDCGAAYSMTLDEFTKKQEQEGGTALLGAQTAVTCQKCGQKSAYVAHKCEKCGEVFIMPMEMGMLRANQDYPDRCPKCGYSTMEERAKKEQQQK